MHFHQILLFIIHKISGQRSENAPFYLLKGKKSGQTIQDVTYFQLHAFFSILPQLSKVDYDAAITELYKGNFIELKESTVHITDKGMNAITQQKKVLLNGWQYRGKEHVFWKRLDLAVQTLSQFHANNKKFVPNQKDIATQQFVKDYLIEHNFRQFNLSNEMKRELHLLLENHSLNDLHRTLFVYRLSGFNTIGLTWEQLARYHQLSELDAKIFFLECLHTMLDNISRETSPLLFSLAKNIRIETPLTDSAFRTNSLFEKGYSLEQIANLRKLKINTIEDHVIEIVSTNKNFPISTFITKEQVGEILHLSSELQTKKLTEIKNRLPEVSYFQVRLALTRSEQLNE
ncbi:helix-turn-helix domain-containing protein [Psychrobacillus sp. NPDC096623]|uniref:helix-turn-helix domain-containing protein n=1 Tax=Psychrobacillus sp. NPDC096623 TaxID=3364492 RepID=UPI003820E67D